MQSTEVLSTQVPTARDASRQDAADGGEIGDGPDTMTGSGESSGISLKTKLIAGVILCFFLFFAYYRKNPEKVKKWFESAPDEPERPRLISEDGKSELYGKRAPELLKQMRRQQHNKVLSRPLLPPPFPPPPPPPLQSPAPTVNRTRRKRRKKSAKTMPVTWEDVSDLDFVVSNPLAMPVQLGRSAKPRKEHPLQRARMKAKMTPREFSSGLGKTPSKGKRAAYGNQSSSAGVVLESTDMTHELPYEDITVYDVPRDGNCLFTCVSKALDDLELSTPHSVQDLRVIVARSVGEQEFQFLANLFAMAWKERDPDLIRDYSFMRNVGSLGQLREEILKPTYFGDEMALKAFESAFPVNCLVLRLLPDDSMQLAVRFKEENTSEKQWYIVLLLHLRSQHYELLSIRNHNVLSLEELPGKIQRLLQQQRMVQAKEKAVGAQVDATGPTGISNVPPPPPPRVMASHGKSSEEIIAAAATATAAAPTSSAVQGASTNIQNRHLHEGVVVDDPSVPSVMSRVRRKPIREPKTRGVGQDEDEVDSESGEEELWVRTASHGAARKRSRNKSKRRKEKKKHKKRRELKHNRRKHVKSKEPTYGGLDGVGKDDDDTPSSNSSSSDSDTEGYDSNDEYNDRENLDSGDGFSMSKHYENGFSRWDTKMSEEEAKEMKAAIHRRKKLEMNQRRARKTRHHRKSRRHRKELSDEYSSEEDGEGSDASSDNYFSEDSFAEDNYDGVYGYRSGRSRKLRRGRRAPRQLSRRRMQSGQNGAVYLTDAFAEQQQTAQLEAMQNYNAAYSNYLQQQQAYYNANPGYQQGNGRRNYGPYNGANPMQYGQTSYYGY